MNGIISMEINKNGRLRFPYQCKDQFTSDGITRMVLTRGTDCCLFIINLEEWDRLVNYLKGLDVKNGDVRSMARHFLADAEEIEVSKRGYVWIPRRLREFAQLESSCLMVCTPERLEIWNPDIFENCLEKCLDGVLPEDTAKDIGIRSL